ncbi:MAG: tripartite tricarboxylate transporter TctB family protein [Chloroflexi bacterium]|nr:tripartite tricarboxylate transporter TctB family protein [Chloroflexota bacterium]MCL5952293.1 tripartite tricarboxylate transporter TctB family protein [Chloroflexota bacterium]
MKAQLPSQLSGESTQGAPRRITGRQIFDLCVMAILAAIVYMALGFNSQARMMPLVVAVPSLLLSIWQTVLDFTAPPKVKKKKAEADGAKEAKKASDSLIAFGWVLLAFVLIYLLGFTITTFLYPLLYMRVRSRMGWGISLGVSIGFVAFLYVVMVTLLQVQLYDGVLVVAVRKAVIGY